MSILIVTLTANNNMNSSSWSELPNELLASIARKLNTEPEILRFRAVCRSWKSSASLQEASPFPVKLPFPISVNDIIHPMRRGFFTLAPTFIYLIQPLQQSGAPYQSLLIRVRKGGKGKLVTLHTFSKEQRIGFSPEIFPKTMNLLDYKVTEVGRSYSMKFTDRSKNKAPPILPRNTIPETIQAQKEAKAVRVTRVVLSQLSQESLIFGIYNEGNLFTMKSSDKNWTVFENGQNSQYQDVAFHKGKCYAIDSSGTVTVLTSSLKLLETIPSPNIIPVTSARNNYLVVSFGDLFLVQGDFEPHLEIDHNDFSYRYMRYDLDTKTFLSPDEETRHAFLFKLYKLNEKQCVWEVVKNMDDRALFVGEDCRFSVLAQDLAGCRGNHIYFEHHFKHWSILDGLVCSEQIGACNVKDGVAGPMCCFPGLAGLLWPPPTWLRPSLISTAEFIVDEN